MPVYSVAVSAGRHRARDSRAGFSLIEILVVVLIIGILTAIAIVNYRNALHLAKQKKTMTDMKTIATSWEARAGDTRTYNAAGQGYSFPSSVMSHADLSSRLAPTYLRTVPRNDGWGNPLDFATDQAVGGATANTYAIRSRGRDGQADATYEKTATDNLDCDIVFSGGSFVVHPVGVQN
ncbi:MAG TPA: prepilin-type N-terminal cleavage/methylation domain-containing protein [Thermoanaerobaculia bacterium]|nr:prepilin-type N-terminal cleavage/methylation domain-containing protein [Thermoanaerobaculia bacterium]